MFSSDGKGGCMMFQGAKIIHSKKELFQAQETKIKDMRKRFSEKTIKRFSSRIISDRATKKCFYDVLLLQKTIELEDEALFQR